MRKFFISLIMIVALTVALVAASFQTPARAYLLLIGQPPPCAQAVTYLARTTSGTEGGNSANITTVICGLVSDGVITGNLSTTGCGTGSLDALYITAQQNTADAQLNICGTNYSLTLNGATFTSYQGYVSGGSTGIDTGFNPTTATSPNFTQNSASFGLWSYVTIVEALSQMSNELPSTAQASALYDSYTGSLVAIRTNENTSGTSAQPGTKGLFAGDRASSSLEAEYWDGSAFSNPNVTSIAPGNADFFIGKGQHTGASAQKFSAAFIGASLGSTNELALYTRLRTYMTAVGVP